MITDAGLCKVLFFFFFFWVMNLRFRVDRLNMVMNMDENRTRKEAECKPDTGDPDFSVCAFQNMYVHIYHHYA